MSQEERYGTRDNSYSAWHRSLSTARFVGMQNARKLAMIDIDACPYVEYQDGSYEILALIETAIDVGQHQKSGRATASLSRDANKPAFVLLYQLSSSPNPADSRYMDIERFRVRRVWPEPTEKWTCYTPQEWADFLLALRTNAVERRQLVMGICPESTENEPLSVPPKLTKKGRRIHDLSEFIELWPAVKNRVKKKIGITAESYLHDAHPVFLSSNDAVIEYKKPFHYAKACDAAKRLPFEQVVNECMASPHRLVLRLAEPPPYAPMVGDGAPPEPDENDDFNTDVTQFSNDVHQYAKEIFAAEIMGRSGTPETVKA